MSIMSKTVRELSIVALGVVIGFFLLYVSSLIPVNKPSVTLWGFPFFWRIVATGSGPDTVWGRLFLDFIFWLALSLVLLEVSSHIAWPYTKRRLKARTHFMVRGESNADR